MDGDRTGCCDSLVKGLMPHAHVLEELLQLAEPVTGDCCVGLDAMAGRVLSQDITAPFSLPSYDNSAMDGYALGQGDDSGTYRIIARTAAGDDAPENQLEPGQAVRIFTGAAIPDGTFTVAMQENVTRNGDLISISKGPIKAQHIRRTGEDILSQSVVLKAGTRLDARHVAIVTALGLSNAWVYSPIRIALFSSGKELREPGKSLSQTAIYDSNRWMLMALLKSPIFKIMDLGILPDNRAAITKVLERAGEVSDLILSTGGVSVGEEDHMFGALTAAGSNVRQYRMAVKPGKPVVFGRIGRAISLCLPGNPVAALVSFQLLVRPVIAALSGGKVAELQPMAAVADFEWSRKPGRSEYFPAQCLSYDSNGMPVLKRLGQGNSAQLSPLIDADGLARVSGETIKITPGDRLDWFPFSGGFPV